MPHHIKLFVITGSMGAGKTTILGEASDLLTASNIAHAAVDLDALGMYHVPDAPTDLEGENLAAVLRNYSAAGIDRLLVAVAIESAKDLERLRAALRDAELTVCRLRAAVNTMQRRVRERERGIFQQRYVDRVATLESRLDEARVEDYSVETEDRTVTDVAREMLERAGWLYAR
jgi:nucleoside-triphosphatase THEP1